MKKKLVFLFVLFAVTMRANVLPEIDAYISELYFYEDNWQLEIGYSQWLYEEIRIDSILVLSSSGALTLGNLNLSEELGVFVIDSDSLGENFTINKSGDTLILYCYADGIQFESYYGPRELIFGDVAGSYLETPAADHSITLQKFAPNISELARYVYGRCANPSIGEANLLGEACAVLVGKLYDHLGEAITNSGFWLDNYFYPDSSGHFEIQVGAYHHYEPNLLYQYKRYTSATTYYYDLHYGSITPFSINPQVGDTIEMDIHFTEEINTKISEEASMRVSVYPNPATNKVFLQSAAFKNYQQLTVKINDINGREVFLKSVEAQEKLQIALAENILPGIYFINIQHKSESIFTEKILINSF